MHAENGSPEPLQRTVKFASERPQVRFTGKSYHPLDNAVLSIPFEAVNVNSVQVTAFRVYDNNVGRFLQTNKLDGEQDLDRVGRFLWRKTIPSAAADADAWTRDELDATQLSQDNPGGLFRITLSINRSNSAYACTPNRQQASPRRKKSRSRTAKTRRKAASSWDYAEETERHRSRPQRWSDRDNPCKDAYYKFANGVRESRNFLASDIGLLVKRDQRGKVHVVATSLKTAQPLSGSSAQAVQLPGSARRHRKHRQRRLRGARTPSTPFYLAAENGGQKGYLKLQHRHCVDGESFDVGGEKVEGGIKGVIYGERGVWRPGDDIHLARSCCRTRNGPFRPTIQ